MEEGSRGREDPISTNRSDDNFSIPFIGKSVKKGIRKKRRVKKQRATDFLTSIMNSFLYNL